MLWISLFPTKGLSALVESGSLFGIPWGRILILGAALAMIYLLEWLQKRRRGGGVPS